MGSADPVEIFEYDPAWSTAFSELAQFLERELTGLILRIEHVGSTSVPGLAAKPILDIDIVIASSDLLPLVIERLAQLGYIHEGEEGIPGREAFDRQGMDVPYDGTGRSWMKQHLYVCAQDSRELARHLLFRDHLRRHPETALAYAGLKRALAQKYRRDREAYTLGKTEFIEKVLMSI